VADQGTRGLWKTESVEPRNQIIMSKHSRHPPFIEMWANFFALYRGQNIAMPVRQGISHFRDLERLSLFCARKYRAPASLIRSCSRRPFSMACSIVGAKSSGT
jgi:hypothetical protein